MKLDNTVADQMVSLLSILKNPLSWFAVLAPSLFLIDLPGFGFFPTVLTSTVLISSTLLFAFSRQKPELVEKSVTEEALGPIQDSLISQTEDIISKQSPVSEAVKQEKEDREGEDLNEIQDYLVRSLDSLSESEFLDQSTTTEDSEVDWPFRENVDQSLDDSDGSISDEESLIEIALPSGHYVGHHKEQEPKFSFHQQKFPDYMPHSIFRQRSLMELFAEFNEMNEEDNLIEIDISMGSIKCPRFEIEA